MGLADKECIPCKGGIPPMERSKAEAMLKELEPGWELTHDGTRLERSYAFKDFLKAMAFANRVAEVAEKEFHHPDLYIAWGKCRVEIWTHKINGLTESDFYFAAKADRAYKAGD
jgi:4a-hydroxytetrahydrobiopterin dehydratase